MNKNVWLKISLCIALIPFFNAMSKDIEEGISWCAKRTMHALAKTITENPVFSIIGAYYLLFDYKAVENNTFWSALFGACLLATFVKNIISPDAYPRNFIAKTIIENPFFSFVAAHMLWFHRNKIVHYPLETMIVGGTLLFDLSANYEAEYNDEGQHNSSNQESNLV